MLMRDVISHYWYQSIEKNFAFVWNKKQEQLVLLAILKTGDIHSSNVTLPTHMGMVWLSLHQTNVH